MLGIEPDLVAVSSTGVIGEYLNMENITKASAFSPRQSLPKAISKKRS